MTSALYRVSTAVIVLSLSALLPLEARAQAGEDPLASAQAAYSEIDFEGTLRFAQAALERGGYDAEQLLRIYELLGLAHTALEQPDEASQVYIKALAIDPEYQLEPGLAPRFRTPYLEARGFWASRAGHLEVEVIFARARSSLRVDLSDPLQMGQTVRVLARLEGELEYNETNLAVQAQAYVPVLGSQDAPRVEYVVQLLDEHGNRLVELGQEDEPLLAGRPVGPSGPVGPVETSRPRWPWIVLGVVATSVVAGVVATGAVLGYQRGQQGIVSSVDLDLSD